jgi:hypothetical protein
MLREDISQRDEEEAPPPGQRTRRATFEEDDNTDDPSASSSASSSASASSASASSASASTTTTRYEEQEDDWLEPFYVMEINKYGFYEPRLFNISLKLGIFSLSPFINSEHVVEDTTMGVKQITSIMLHDRDPFSCTFHVTSTMPPPFSSSAAAAATAAATATAATATAPDERSGHGNTSSVVFPSLPARRTLTEDPTRPVTDNTSGHHEPPSPPSPHQRNQWNEHKYRSEVIVQFEHPSECMDCVAILLKIHNQYEGERIQLCEGMPDSSYQTEWVRFDSIKITKSRVHKRRTLLVNALHGILHIFKTVREIGICYTCWWYSLCNFQYRHQYENTGSDHFEC